MVQNCQEFMNEVNKPAFQKSNLVWVGFGKSELNSPSVGTDLRGTHGTSLGALPPLYSVESTHL